MNASGKSYFWFKLLVLLMAVLAPVKFLEAQRNKVLTPYELRLKGGEMKELFRQVDPAGKLSRDPRWHLFFGLGMFYHLDERSRVGLEYNRITIGRSAFFPDPDYMPWQSTTPNFNEFSFNYERDLLSIGRRRQWVLSAAAGPAFSFTGFPDATGTSTVTIYNNMNDTVYHIRDTNWLGTGIFFSVKALINLRYELGKQLHLTTGIGLSQNLTGQRISIYDINYRHPLLQESRQARIETLGHVRNFFIMLSYRFARRGGRNSF